MFHVKHFEDTFIQ